MIISIRYVYPNWHWEIFSVGREASHADGRYATGISSSWKEMTSAIEVHISELERRYEKRNGS